MIRNFGWFFIKTMWATRLLNLHQYSWIVLILITIVWCVTSWCIDMIGNQIIIDFGLDDLKDKNTMGKNKDDKDKKQ